MTTQSTDGDEIVARRAARRRTSGRRPLGPRLVLWAFVCCLAVLGLGYLAAMWLVLLELLKALD